MGYIKVSFIGDIMCEKPFLHAARTGRRQYDFEPAFFGLTNLFHKSDYVIGNLETVCAGEGMSYTHELYSFNTPDSFISALKKCGVDFVSTANNHCLDRGIDGMRRTLDVLDLNRIRHTGTYKTKQEAEQPCILDINGLKLGLIAYTYGTNSNINGIVLKDDELFSVDLLQPQKYEPDTSLTGKMKGLASDEVKTQIRKMLGMPYKNITVDNMPKEFDERYLENIAASIKRIKKNTDYTICLLHCGGQFNQSPGKYSKFMIDFLQRQGIDSIIGNHPHNVQKAESLNKGIAAYCLGNVSISPSSLYVPMENLPDYSIALHLYFHEKDKSLNKITVSVLKIEEDKNHYLKVSPVWNIYQSLARPGRDELSEKTNTILHKFMGYELPCFKMQEEWDFRL